MNWKEIKEKYPLAFEKFQGNKDRYYWDVVIGHDRNNNEWSYLDLFRNEMRDMDGSVYHNRDLYNFFDDNLFMIEIFINFTRVGYGSPLYAFRVKEFTENSDNDSSTLYRSRTECEIDAFTEAFKKLNHKLIKLQ